MQMRHLKFDEWVISVILVVSFVYVNEILAKE
jgi:hypothetical protein